MTKNFKELVLEKDTVFEGSIEVETSIRCAGNERFNLTVKGDIKAGDITAWDIDAWDIDARDINARDINAGNINAGDINAWDINARDIKARDIICESRKKKDEENKTVARIFITDRSKLHRKEW